MFCPHCHSDLPEGLEACFRCGKPLRMPVAFKASSEPIREEHRPASSECVCPHCGGAVPCGLTVCFHCGKPMRTSVKPSAPPPTASKERAARRRTDVEKEKPQRSGKTAGIAALLLIFLLGGAVAGHYLGLYTLPLLPDVEVTEDAEEGREEPEDEGASAEDKPEEGSEENGEVEEGFRFSGFSRGGREYDSAISGIVIVAEDSWQGELQISDLSGVVMTRDGEEIPVAFEGEVERSDRDEERNEFLCHFTERFTEPGEYEITFTLNGDTYSGETVIESADPNDEAEDESPPDQDNPSTASTALTIDADDLPDIEFTVDDVVILETTIDEIWEMYAQFNPDENANGVGTNIISDRGTEITGFHFSDTRDDDGIVDNIGIQDQNMRFQLLGKYVFGMDAPTLFTDFTGLDPNELAEGWHVLYDDDGTFLEVKIEPNGYWLDYTEGEVCVMISVTDDRITHFDMRRADIQ